MDTIHETGTPILAEGATGTVLETLLRHAYDCDDSNNSNSKDNHGESKSDDSRRPVSARDLLLAPLENQNSIRELHRRYIAAGARIIKTATFSANLIDIPKIDKTPRSSEEAETFCYELNRNAAIVSKSAAAALCSAHSKEKAPTNTILTAGSIGPGSLLPSLGQAEPEAIRRAYKPQVYGLIEGGVDILLIETVQDILHCKTILALAREALLTCGKTARVMVSATLTTGGTLLCGTELGAFAEIIAPYEPEAIGLNCSGGPLELSSFIEKLASLTKLPLSIMPNAGLPVMEHGKTVWPMKPEAWAQAMLGIIGKNRIAIAGGCCGSTPEHIAALSTLVETSDPKLRDPMQTPETAAYDPKLHARPALASLYTACYTVEAPLIIDERANTQGSKAFKEAIGSENAEQAANHVISLAETDSHALDLAIARPGKDDTVVYENIVKAIGTKIRQAIVIDTMSEAVFAKTLPLIPGKPLMNSINLEDEDRAKRLLALAKQHGAAVVLLAMDKSGPAKTAEAKVSVSKRLFELAVAAGIREEDIFFDACTFPVLSAGPESAAATLEAIKTLKKLYPRSGTILGVGNVSYGLARNLRDPVTRYFYHKALEAGLDAAIINPKSAARALNNEERLLLENFFHKPDINMLREYFEGRNECTEEAPDNEARDTDLGALVVRGKKHRIAEPALQEYLVGLSTEAKISAVLDAMQEVARRFDNGNLSLPEVMLAAETAKLVLAGKSDVTVQEERPRVVLATVKGDLHDIGKNMVSLVLEAGNIEVIDLGIDVPAKTIIDSAEKHKAHAVGVSGLLTRSLPEMQEVARALRESNASAALICGGAAVSQDFVSEHIEPIFSSKVYYGKDPFDALRLIKTITASPQDRKLDTAPTPVTETTSSHTGTSRSATSVSSSVPQHTSHQAHNKPVATSQETTEAAGHGTIALHELLESIDLRRLIHARLNYRNFAEGFAHVQKAAEFAKTGNIKLLYAYRICASYCESPASLRFTYGKESARFPIPVRQDNESIAGFFKGSGAVFCCTLGSASTKLVHAISGKTMSEGVLLHALFAELTEAGAELVHAKLKAETRSLGGKRYSFGFPGAPGVEHNAALLDFLSADTIGLSAAPSGELVPEYSITAIVSFDPNAKYFDA